MKIPFDIKFRPQIESGEYKVEIGRDNSRPARICCWDFNDDTLIVICKNPERTEEALCYTKDGKRVGIYKVPDSDLFLVTPEEEPSEFELALDDTIRAYQCDGEKDESGFPLSYQDWIRHKAAKLLTLAREQFIKDGYVIEKKVSHDTLKDVPRWEKYPHNAGKEPLVNGILQEDDSYKWRLYLDGYKIEIDDLKKLPGFKEK